MKDRDYENRMFKKFQADFTESEVIQILSKKLSERNFEIGTLQSELHELEDKIKSLTEYQEDAEFVNTSARSAVRKEDLYNQIREENKRLRKTNKSLKNTVNELLLKLNVQFY